MKNYDLCNVTLSHHIACDRNVTEALAIGRLCQNKSLQRDHRMSKSYNKPY